MKFYCFILIWLAAWMAEAQTTNNPSTNAAPNPAIVLRWSTNSYSTTTGTGLDGKGWNIWLVWTTTNPVEGQIVPMTVTWTNGNDSFQGPFLQLNNSKYITLTAVSPTSASFYYQPSWTPPVKAALGQLFTNEIGFYASAPDVFVFSSPNLISNVGVYISGPTNSIVPTNSFY